MKDGKQEVILKEPGEGIVQYLAKENRQEIRIENSKETASGSPI
jgi:hypothetical protein